MDQRNAASERTRVKSESEQCGSDGETMIYDARGNGGGYCMPYDNRRSPEPNHRLHGDYCFYALSSFGQYIEGTGTLRAGGGDCGGE